MRSPGSPEARVAPSGASAWPHTFGCKRQRACLHLPPLFPCLSRPKCVCVWLAKAHELPQQTDSSSASQEGTNNGQGECATFLQQAGGVHGTLSLSATKHWKLHRPNYCNRGAMRWGSSEQSSRFYTTPWRGSAGQLPKNVSAVRAVAVFLMAGTIKALRAIPFTRTTQPIDVSPLKAGAQVLCTALHEPHYNI